VGRVGWDRTGDSRHKRTSGSEGVVRRGGREGALRAMRWVILWGEAGGVAFHQKLPSEWPTQGARRKKKIQRETRKEHPNQPTTKVRDKKPWKAIGGEKGNSGLYDVAIKPLKGP